MIAGSTGVGLSQRAQSFVTRREDGPFNVIEPGKRPRVTLTPTLALKDGLPYLSFAVQGGDSQDQNLLQFFLNVVEFGMTVSRRRRRRTSTASRCGRRSERTSRGRAHAGRASHAGQRSQLAPADGLHARVRGADVRTDQRDLLRPEAWNDVGWIEQSRRRLRNRVVEPIDGGSRLQ